MTDDQPMIVTIGLPEAGILRWNCDDHHYRHFDMHVDFYHDNSTTQAVFTIQASPDEALSAHVVLDKLCTDSEPFSLIYKHMGKERHFESCTAEETQHPDTFVIKGFERLQNSRTEP